MVKFDANFPFNKSFSFKVKSKIENSYLEKLNTIYQVILMLQLKLYLIYLVMVLIGNKLRYQNSILKINTINYLIYLKIITI